MFKLCFWLTVKFSAIIISHQVLKRFILVLSLCWIISVADPGFPRGGGANSPGGTPTYDFAKCSQKLHEIERIWSRGGGPRPLDPPLNMIRKIKYRKLVLQLEGLIRNVHQIKQRIKTKVPKVPANPPPPPTLFITSPSLKDILDFNNFHSSSKTNSSHWT